MAAALATDLANPKGNLSGRSLSWDFTSIHWGSDAVNNANGICADNAYFDEGPLDAYFLPSGCLASWSSTVNRDFYATVGLAGKPLIVTEISSSDGESAALSASANDALATANDALAGNQITGILDNLKAHTFAINGEQGVVGGLLYELYQEPGNEIDRFLYTYQSGTVPGPLSAQGVAVQSWIQRNGNPTVMSSPIFNIKSSITSATTVSVGGSITAAISLTPSSFGGLVSLSYRVWAIQSGCLIGLHQSPHAEACQTDLNGLHEKMWSAGLISAEQIGGNDIHDPRRNLTHHAFTDVTYTTLWAAGLRTVNVPGVNLASDETPDAFYKRLVGTDSLYLAVHELDQCGDNFLRQFRAFHQMSEILARQANQLIARSIRTVLDTDDELFVAYDDMSAALELIGQINNNIVPILRNLSVKRYQEIRGSLGITSGSHSPNIKRGLFTTLYPLFVEAVKLRVMDLETYDDRVLRETIRQIANHPTQNRETYDRYELLRKANQLHAALRTWRELHMQFIKTHLGISMVTPTASISGAINGGLTATRMMSHAHGRETDPIVPIYEVLLRRPFEFSVPSANPPCDSFPVRMESATIAVVVELSADVQQRAVAMRHTST